MIDFHFTIFKYPKVYIPFSKNTVSYPGTLGWNFCHFGDPCLGMYLSKDVYIV